MSFINPIPEAMSSIRQNKTRSILAGFGVAWGIFILMLLLGTGKGFQQGILRMFSAFAQNSIWVYGGQVSDNNLSHKTQSKFVLFDNNDITIAKEHFSEIEYISPELSYNGNSLTSYRQSTTYPQIKGVLSDYFKIKLIKPQSGRLLDVLDNKESRRVALIGKQVSDILFPTEKPIGKSIDIAGTYFTVIGVIEKGSLFTQNEQNTIYIPCNTFIECYNQGREYSTFILGLTKKTDATIFETRFKSYIARRKFFNIDDKKALYIINFETQIKSFDKLFDGINIFLWFIGLCLLLSGVVGISNIMLVIVKERTTEIGIRKAIGAKPNSITWMIITESIATTALAGAVGLLFGIFIISILNWILASFYTSKDSLFTSAGIDFPVILFSLVILIFSGVLAGFLPAKKASEVTPIEAIK